MDDMVVKLTIYNEHVKNLTKVFHLMKNHDLRLNPDKCSFVVEAGEFLGFVLLHREIEENPTNCRPIIEM